MKHNVGKVDRYLRALAALGLFGCAIFAPLPLMTRIFALALPGFYVLGTALVGTCLGYRLMGRSTCPASSVASP